MFRHPRSALAAAVLSVSLLAAGCSGDDDNSDGPATTVTSDSAAPDSAAPDSAATDTAADSTAAAPTTTGAATTEPASTEALEAETIDWRDCDGLQCGTVTVPIDPTDPSLGSLDIAVNVHRATDPERRIGYLVVNPGGPGGSGLELAADAETTFSPELIARFDIVGFDPRGVGESEPDFACGDGNEQDEAVRPLSFPLDESEVSVGEAAARLCEDSMGPVAGRLGTQFVAHDIDAIRAALGAEQISYLGYSYGSAVGVWYADQYPDRVRAMVVDGADEVVEETESREVRIQSALDDIRSFADQLDLALAACSDESCPIYNDGDPEAAYLEAVERQDVVTEAADGNTQATLLGIVTFLYDQTTWPALYDAVAALRDGDPDPMMAAYRLQQAEDGPSFTAHVNCLDAVTLSPLTRQEAIDDAVAAEAAATEEFPLLMAASPTEVGVCPFFDVLDRGTFEGPLDGADVPILVIGNRSDPATSFSDSERLATEVLANGYLVETDHYRHTVFPQNQCVNGYVHDLLLDEQLPADRRVTCEREEPKPEFAEPEVRLLCEQIAEVLESDLGTEEVTAVCDEFVPRLTEGRTYEEIIALMLTSDDDDIQFMIEQFEASVSAALD